MGSTENKRNLYEILDVKENSSLEDIKKSYQNLVLKYHPDKQNTDSYENYLEVNEAWKTLRDPELRNIYNAELLQKKFNENPIIYDRLALKDFSYDEENDEYFCLCKCGGVYIVPSELRIESKYDECFISCDECSLVVELIPNK